MRSYARGCHYPPPSRLSPAPYPTLTTATITNKKKIMAVQALGVQNAYFPLFVSKRALETEKDHVEGFAPEVLLLVLIQALLLLALLSLNYFL